MIREYLHIPHPPLHSKAQGESGPGLPPEAHLFSLPRLEACLLCLRSERGC